MSERQRLTRATLEHCARRLSLRPPVRVLSLSMRAERNWARAHPGGGTLHGRYCGRDTFDGAHLVEVSTQRRGIGLVNTLAHELAHAAQRELTGDAFDVLYDLEQRAHGYERNGFEIQAREFAAAMVRELAQSGTISLEV